MKPSAAALVAAPSPAPALTTAPAPSPAPAPAVAGDGAGAPSVASRAFELEQAQLGMEAAQAGLLSDLDLHLARPRPNLAGEISSMPDLRAAKVVSTANLQPSVAAARSVSADAAADAAALATLAIAPLSASFNPRGDAHLEARSGEVEGRSGEIETRPGEIEARSGRSDQSRSSGDAAACSGDDVGAWLEADRAMAALLRAGGEGGEAPTAHALLCHPLSAHYLREFLSARRARVASSVYDAARSNAAGREAVVLDL